MKRTESVLVGLVCAVLALLFAYLCVYGSIFTSTIAEKHYTVETIVQVQDQPLFSLLGLLVACGILWLFSKVEGKIPLRAMVIFSLVWAALLGTLWVLAVRTEPRADAAEIVDAARQAMSRNYTELKRKDGYMNRHPYQLGFMAFSQLLQTIFGPKNYLALQLVNVAFLTLAYGGTLRLLWLMTKKARTVRYGALLLLLCLQPILYVTFLYGNMASIACTLWAMCCLCRLARDGGAWRLIPAGLLCGLSVMMKPNGWIPVIAMLIVTGLWFLSEKKWKLLPLLFLGFYGEAGFGEAQVMQIISLIIPFILGMVLGDMDMDIRKVFAGGNAIILPFLGFEFGSTINLIDAVKGPNAFLQTELDLRAHGAAPSRLCLRGQRLAGRRGAGDPQHGGSLQHGL